MAWSKSGNKHHLQCYPRVRWAVMYVSRCNTTLLSHEWRKMEAFSARLLDILNSWFLWFWNDTVLENLCFWLQFTPRVFCWLFSGSGVYFQPCLFLMSSKNWGEEHAFWEDVLLWCEFICIQKSVLLSFFKLCCRQCYWIWTPIRWMRELDAAWHMGGKRVGGILEISHQPSNLHGVHPETSGAWPAGWVI